MQRRLMLSLSLLVALAATGSMAAAKPTPVVVELFTSEGCSSCPAADTLLAKLIDGQPVAGAEIIGLGQHVDYWDHQGWKDRFASPSLTARQQLYSRAFSIESMYTPQMIVDGRAEFVGSDANAARRAIEKAAAIPHGTLTMTVEHFLLRVGPHPHALARSSLLPRHSRFALGFGVPLEAPHPLADALVRNAWTRVADGRGRRRSAGNVTVIVDIRTLPKLSRGDRAEVVLTIAESGLTSRVGGGENTGRTLRHAAVVRKLETIGNVKDGGASVRSDVALDAAWQRDHLTIVAFVQERASRRILASAATRLQPLRP